MVVHWPASPAQRRSSSFLASGVLTGLRGWRRSHRRGVRDAGFITGTLVVISASTMLGLALLHPVLNLP
jgi:hypothetical protein